MSNPSSNNSLLPICAIILVGSNEGKLDRCVQSLSFVSSIILADNNSGYAFAEFESDPRITVVHRNEPITDFASVRQELMSLSTHPWVLFVDRDEVVTVENLSELSQQLDNSGVHGLSVQRSDIFYGKPLSYGEAGSQQLIRLVRPEFCHWYNPVHEVARIEGSVVASSIRIDHYAHDSISEFIDDVSRYAALVADTRQSTAVRNLLEMMTFPLAKLFYILIVQGGALDGWRGVVYASVMSIHSLLVRLYWYEKHNSVAHT